MGSRIKILFVGFVFFANSARCIGITEDAADDYYDFIARMNHYSPMEPAGSHGTIGGGLGLGVAGYKSSETPEILKQHWRGRGVTADENRVASDRVMIPRVYVHKGFPLALDFGLGFGQEGVTKAIFASGYGQWTFFEAFALPAASIRTSFSRLMNLATTDASSIAFDGLVSYGFLRIFTIYGAYGFGRHHIQIHSGAEYGTNLRLDDEASATADKIYFKKSQTIGLQVQLLPPVCNASIEVAKQENNASSFLGKISIGI